MSSIVDTLVRSEVPAVRTWVENRMVYLELSDERVLRFPAARFKLLA